MKTIKKEVCPDCLSDEIIDIDCRCTYMKYEPIELEFEYCECCNRSDSEPANTEFNEKQLEMLKNEKKFRFK